MQCIKLLPCKIYFNIFIFCITDAVPSSSICRDRTWTIMALQNLLSLMVLRRFSQFVKHPTPISPSIHTNPSDCCPTVFPYLAYSLCSLWVLSFPFPFTRYDSKNFHLSLSVAVYQCSFWYNFLEDYFVAYSLRSQYHILFL